MDRISHDADARATRIFEISSFLEIKFFSASRGGSVPILGRKTSLIVPIWDDWNAATVSKTKDKDKAEA